MANQDKKEIELKTIQALMEKADDIATKGVSAVAQEMGLSQEKALFYLKKCGFRKRKIKIKQIGEHYYFYGTNDEPFARIRVDLVYQR